MHSRRYITIVIASAGLGLGCLSASGCGDDSKTTGTQVQLTEKDRADINAMREAMKGQRAALQQERAKDRKRKG